MAKPMKNQSSEHVTEIGTISITKSTEISFYLDTYRGKRYANIRKFTRSDRYTGATPQGIKLSQRNLTDIIAARDQIIRYSQNPEEIEVLRTPKFVGRDMP